MQCVDLDMQGIIICYQSEDRLHMLIYCRREDISMATAKKWITLQCCFFFSISLPKHASLLPDCEHCTMFHSRKWVIKFLIMTHLECTLSSLVRTGAFALDCERKWIHLHFLCVAEQVDDEHCLRRIHNVKNTSYYSSLAHSCVPWKIFCVPWFKILDYNNRISVCCWLNLFSTFTGRHNI